jgi:hypothetical protein
MIIVQRLPYAALPLLALLVAHLTDIASREGALRQFLNDRSQGITRIAKDYGVSAERCANEPMRDLYALAAALLTVETFVTPQLENWARAAIVDIAGSVGTTPDFSIGPARIKLSTARMALNQSQSVEIRSYKSLSDAALARKLLSPCDSIQVASAILEHIRAQGSEYPTGIDRRFVRFAASSYNGQSKSTNSLEAILSAEIYFELVYDTFQHYRFLALH